MKDPLTGLDQDSAFLQSALLKESQRRTRIMTYILIGIWSGFFIGVLIAAMRVLP